MIDDPSTMTDPRSRRSWRITGPVIRLREHGADRVYGLPAPPTACRIGIASELRLHDPTGTVSRAHAEIMPVEVDGALLWKIHDLKSKNGLRCDGEPQMSFFLRPGIEVSLGSLRLVAESVQLIGLLSLLRRFLGWAVSRQEPVEQALRTLRDWAAQRAELIVVGDGDLLPVVRRLHHLVVGDDVSFRWCEPTESIEDAAATVKAAAAGTLCIKVERQADAMAVIERVRAAEFLEKPQLVLCIADPASAATFKASLERPAVIHLPSLETRTDELEDILLEFAREIAQELRLPGPGISPRDVEQLRAMEFRSLAGIEDTARRLVILRTWGLRAGAARLGIDYSSLRAWAQHRKLET